MSKQHETMTRSDTKIQQLKQALTTLHQIRHLMMRELSQQRLIREVCLIFTENSEKRLSISHKEGIQ